MSHLRLPISFPIRAGVRHAALCCAAGAIVMLAAPAFAREPLVLDAKARAEIIDSLTRQVALHYVEADTARMIAAAVRARQGAGAYDALTEPAAFSEAVTRDLRKVNGDLHLSLRYDPDGTGPLGQPMLRRVMMPAGGGHGGPIIIHRSASPGEAGAGPPGAGPGGAPAGPAGPFMRGAREQNFGLTRLEILPGNVGYLEVSGFMGAEDSDAAIADALRFLERTDAVIIDVRRNGGGNGQMSHMLFSHFLPAKPVPTIRVKSRDAEGAVTQESFAEVPGPRRPDVPLYVLTSRGTASAAEEFSFVLKNLGRATLVGDRTAGAGHMVAGYNLPMGFVAGVSITRVSDPRTGLEWEAIGVQPDVRVPAEQALGVAHGRALRALAAKADDPARRDKLERTAEWAEARARGVAVDAGRLAAIAGTYEGDRTVEIVEGKPVYRRAPGVMPEELVPLGGDRYALMVTGRMTFAPGSPSPSVKLERTDGSSLTYPRARVGKLD